MTDKTNLEKTIEYAISGVPEIKAEEKRKWLGEFRERVILGLTMEQSYMKEATYYAEDALNDKKAEIVIVNQNIAMDVMSKYMKLSKITGKDFKSLATNNKEAMGIVVVSKQAVERENVEVKIQELPDSYKDVNNNKICQDCHKELSKDFPRYKDKFKKFGFLDKITRAICPICKK